MLTGQPYPEIGCNGRHCLQDRDDVPDPTSDVDWLRNHRSAGAAHAAAYAPGCPGGAGVLGSGVLPI